MPIYSYREVIAEFFKYCKQHKPLTVERNLLARKHLDRFFDGLYMSGESRVIDGATVARYRELRKADGRSPVTVKRELAVASAAVNYCRGELYWDLPNPFQGRLISKADARRQKPEKRTYTAAEEAALLLAGDHALFRDMFRFGVLTGFRAGEIRGLTWDRVDGDTVYFTPELQKSGRYGTRALPPEAVQIVKRQPRSGPYVFHVDGKQIRKETLCRWFRAARVKAGIPDVVFKHARKTFGQRAVDAGASMEAVQSQLGHEDIRTTQSWYVQPSITLARVAVQAGKESG
jgi:integrase